MAGLSNGLFQAFLNWLYRSSVISVPSDFYSRCQAVNYMLDSDISGLINTVMDYSINSATDAEFKVECSEPTLEHLLNMWLGRINQDIEGVPSGLTELSKEYYKERWEGSSFCILRVKNWEEISYNNTTIYVPTVMWFVNGSSVYVDREDEDNHTLGSDKYYLDENHTIAIPARNEDIIVQKPYGRWFDEYPTPFLIRKGVYKNWKAMEVLQEKSDEVISKVLPYLFVIEKGTEKLLLEGNADYTTEDFKKLVAEFKKEAEKYKYEGAKVPLNAIPFDQKYKHLIPDLRNILTEELYRQGYRSILSGLGFVDVIQGVSSTRKESVLNPKPFVSEISAGVDGFESILMDVINLIVEYNKDDHRKFFSENNTIQIVHSPLSINTEQILEYIRSGFDRGIISIKSFIQALGFDFDTEKERRLKELKEGDEDLFYPHLIQNKEDTPDRLSPTKPRNENEENKENENKQPNSPESQNFQATIPDLEEETMDMVIVKGFAPEITKNYIRLRQVSPDRFQKNSFRTITLNKARGIKVVIGRLKGKKTTTIQSYLFDRKNWTVKEAQEWVKQNRALVIELVEGNMFDNLESAPYNLKNAPKSIKKLPKDLQELWVEVWNDTYDKYGDEARAHRTAWYVVNKERNKNKKKRAKAEALADIKAEVAEKQLKLLKKLEKGDKNEDIHK